MASGTAGNSTPKPWKSLITADAMRRLVFTLAVLAVYRLGLNLPAPGLNPDAIPGLGPHDIVVANAAIARLSPFAFGLGPVFSILVAAELLKLAAPGLRAWLKRGPANSFRFGRYILTVAFALTALQAYGVALGLEGIPARMGTQLLVPDPGIGFQLSYIVSTVAGTALLVWLADQVTRYGLGSGFWIILLSPSVSELASLPGTLNTLFEVRQIEASQIAWIFAAVIAAIAVVVCLYRRAHIEASVTASEGLQTTTREICDEILWPVMIGLTLAGYIAGYGSSIMVRFALAETNSQVLASGSWGFLTLTTACIFLIAILSALSKGADDRHRDQRERIGWALQTALASSAVCIAMEIIFSRYFVPVTEGGWFIAMVLVCLVMLPGNIAEFFPAPSALTDESPPA